MRTLPLRATRTCSRQSILRTQHRISDPGCLLFFFIPCNELVIERKHAQANRRTQQARNAGAVALSLSNRWSVIDAALQREVREELQLGQPHCPPLVGPCALLDRQFCCVFGAASNFSKMVLGHLDLVAFIGPVYSFNDHPEQTVFQGTTKSRLWGEHFLATLPPTLFYLLCSFDVTVRSHNSNTECLA